MDVVGIFYGNLVYFMAIWYILWSFGIFSPVLVCCTKEHLATLFWLQRLTTENGHPAMKQVLKKCLRNMYIG
jgi:hypothetical protein